MAVELLYNDGTSEIVERCLLVEDRVLGKNGRRRWRQRFCAQRQPGAPLRWLQPKELANVNVEAPINPSQPSPRPPSPAA